MGEVAENVKPKIVVFFQTGKNIGEGHKYRSLELIRVANEQGFNCVGLSDCDATSLHYSDHSKSPQEWMNKGRWHLWMNIIKADWIVFDLPYKPKDYQIDYCKSKGMRIANLNGPGWTERNGISADQSWADLVWVQDSPERVILRNKIQEVVRQPLQNQWFVFGGSADPMDIMSHFEDAIRNDPAFLVGTELRDIYTPKWAAHNYTVTDGEQIWELMRHASRACVSMGIIAWELAAMGIPQYIFSRSEEHLHYAKIIENLGLGLAYPVVGIPDGKTMREFFRKQYTYNAENKPDFKAAERFLKELKAIDGLE